MKIIEFDADIVRIGKSSRGITIPYYYFAAGDVDEEKKVHVILKQEGRV